MAAVCVSVRVCVCVCAQPLHKGMPVTLRHTVLRLPSALLSVRGVFMCVRGCHHLFRGPAWSHVLRNGLFWGCCRERSLILGGYQRVLG